MVYLKDADTLGETMTDIMYQIEGIGHFVIDNLFHFEYLNQQSGLNQASLATIADQWYTTLRQFNAQLLQELSKSQEILKSAEENSQI